jgi:hypothetical protein
MLTHYHFVTEAGTTLYPGLAPGDELVPPPAQRRLPGQRLCEECSEHRAVFLSWRGALRRRRAKRDRQHTLCPRCWRSWVNRGRAETIRRRYYVVA